MRNTLLTYIILLFFSTVQAQDISINAEYPEVVTAGQQFRVEWSINANGGDFAAPPFEGFYKLMGPQTSFSSSTQIINGKVTKQSSFTYIYFLQAVSEGKFVIAPAKYTLKNKTYFSDSLHIEVIAVASQQQNQNPSSQANSNSNSSNNENVSGDIFVSLLLNRKDIYLGEHVAATVKLFTRVNLSGINEIKYPSFNGFLKSDITTPPLSSLKQENVNGTIYGTGVVQQFLLYPQVTGEITIDPVQLSVLIQQKSRQSDPFFGDFFTSYQTVPKVVASRSVKLNVKPLPGSQPDDYSGIVGKLNIKASINNDSVNVNDAINLRITVSGNGNLKIAAAPKLKLSPDIEVYDPKITDNIKYGTDGASGQKTFEYILIPRHYGDFTIPPVTYSFFNTASGKYQTLTTEEFHFHARKGNEQNSGITVYGGVSKEDVKYLGKDIRFIKSSAGNLDKKADLIITNRSFYSAYLFSVFIFLVILFIRREHVRRNADLSLVKNRRAGKVAVKRLRSAAVCIKNGHTDKFYEEILKAIWGYLSDKLNIPLSDLSRTNAVELLKKNGIEDEKINSLISILDICEYARYAPSSSGTELEKTYEGASQFIKSIENSIS